MLILPKKINPASQINLVHTSSPVSKSDMVYFKKLVSAITKTYPNFKIFDVEQTILDLRYLAASENERLKQFRRALKKVDWLAPIYGGTGCADIIRYLKDDELSLLRRNRPVVNGFSDTTFLLNYLYFKIRLLTFHYSNACGLFVKNNIDQFLKIITGDLTSYCYERKGYHWLNPNEGIKEKIEGIAIGGNLTTFRDLLDICDIRPRSWEDYILFIEDTGIDMEDLHRIIIALDERNIFMHIKAIVLGAMDEKSFSRTWSSLNFMHNKKGAPVDHIFEYLISDVIEERIEDRDPLYILKVDNFGHGIDKDQMILPIGAKTTIYPSGKIEFTGPFVE